MSGWFRPLLGREGLAMKDGGRISAAFATYSRVATLVS